MSTIGWDGMGTGGNGCTPSAIKVEIGTVHHWGWIGEDGIGDGSPQWGDRKGWDRGWVLPLGWDRQGWDWSRFTTWVNRRCFPVGE